MSGKKGKKMTKGTRMKVFIGVLLGLLLVLTLIMAYATGGGEGLIGWVIAWAFVIVAGGGMWFGLEWVERGE